MEDLIHTDIFIAGAGASGIAAAVAASGLGLKVCIAELHLFPGGRATASAVGTVCGLYYRSHNASPEYAMKGFPKEFGERLISISGKPPQKFSEGLWFLPCLPKHFEQVALSYLNHEKIKVCYNTKIVNVDYFANRISKVICEHAGSKVEIIADIFIDCSGEGVLCTAINHEVIKDEVYQAAAIVFSIDNIKISDEFSLSYSLIKQIMKNREAGTIPGYFDLLSVVPGSLHENSILLKFGLPYLVTGNNASDIDLNLSAKDLVEQAIAFIRQNITGFENASKGWIANEVGIRTGIRARGKKTLTDNDVLNCVKHHDGICNGAWPVEYWRTGNKKVEMTWFNENDFYTIPANCLVSPEKENLFFAGKIISAEEKAIASARVIGTCLGAGYAAGVIAGYKIKNRGQDDAVDFIQAKMLCYKK